MIINKTSLYNKQNKDSITIPENIVKRRRVIYLTRMFLNKPSLINPSINERIEIDKDGNLKTRFSAFSDIILTNYSVTRQKHPETQELEEMTNFNTYFGKIWYNNQSNVYEGIKSIKMTDKIVIEDYFYNVIFDNFRSLYMESYVRSNSYNYEDSYRNLLNKATKLECPNPKYYTYYQQIENEGDPYTMNKYFSDVTENRIDIGLDIGTVGDIFDKDNTYFVELYVDLNGIAKFILDSGLKNQFLDTIMYMLGCIKMDMEQFGFCSSTIIMDTLKGFKIDSLNSYVNLHKSLQSQNVSNFLNLISGRYHDSFVPIYKEIGQNLILFIHIDPVSTKVKVISEKINENSDYIQHDIMTESLMEI